MKKKILILPLMAFTLMSAFVVFSKNASASQAHAYDDCSVYTIIGDAALMGSEWDPTDTANDMTDTGGGHYKLVKQNVTLSAGDYMYKMVGEHTFGVYELPAYGNQVLTIDEDGTYTVTFEGDRTELNASYVASTPTNIFASLEELVTKLPATDTTQNVTVTITDAVIDDFYVSSKGYTNGIYVTAASTTVEFYCNDVPDTWEVGGKVSGTIKAEWLLYKGVPELQKWEGGWDAFTYTAPVAWPADAPTEAPAVPTHDGTSLLGAPLTTNLEFEPLDWPGSMPEELTFETGETIYYMKKMNWQIYTNWAEDSYDMSEYDMFHIDLFPSTGTEIKVTFEGLGDSDGGQGYKNSVVKTLTAGEWNGLDIVLSEFPGLFSGDAYDFSDIKYLILEGYDADQTALSVGNVYFYKGSTPKEFKYTTYENWQIKYGNEWTWSDNMDKVGDGLYKIEILWEGTGFNVKSDENPIKKDWYDKNDPDVIIGEEVIAPVTVDIYLKVIDDETLKIGIGVEPHVHAIETTHAKVEAKCEEAGHEVYYECDCGKYYSDEALTEEIPDLDLWLAEDGEGYLAPLGHHFSGEVTYTWDADKCTASWKCDHAGCTETQTETVTGVYVKDSDATTESNEKGHYEAAFSLQEFGTNSTAPNSVEMPNTKLPSGLSGGAIAGIVIGSVFGLLIIGFVVLYILWKRKNLNVPVLSKVLTPAFRFINKLFFKTKLNDVEAKEAENKAMKE